MAAEVSTCARGPAYIYGPMNMCTNTYKYLCTHTHLGEPGMCESAKNTKAVQGPSQQVETCAGHISTYYYLGPRQGAVTRGPGTVNNLSCL